MTERICILPDTQLPFTDLKALRAVIQYIADAQPDRVIHIGDVMDYPTPSRWSKGSAEEFSKVLRSHNDHAKRNLLEPLRAVYDGPVGFHEGNHDLRARAYLSKYAPALAEFEGMFSIEHLLDFDGFGIEMLPDFYDVAPGWITTHGHMGKISLSQIAGNTALGAAKKFYTSVVMGHTHRMGVLSYTGGYAGRVRKTVSGMEVGNLMNMKQAAYLSNGTGNWQQGFGLLTVDRTHVKPETVPISQGRFTVDGETWEV